MNQEKIGKFIQEMRKQKRITQQELAEKLGVSDKSISRWENGINLPDASIYNSLCEELDISINELLSGQKLKEKEYQQKLEENIVLLNDTTKKSVRKFKKYMIITIILFVLLIFLSGLLLYIKNRYDYQLSVLNIDEVKYKVCEYNSRYNNEKRILVKVYAKDNGGSMLRVLHDYEDDKILVVNNTRYKKWLYNKKELEDIKTDIISTYSDYKKIYYRDTLIWDDSQPLDECVESKGFTRTYQILNIKNNDKEYIYLTISEFQNEKPYVVKVRTELVSSIEVGKNYEFSFRHNLSLGYILKDEISVIFENLELISVKETNKTGLDQIHDEIW